MTNNPSNPAFPTPQPPPVPPQPGGAGLTPAAAAPPRGAAPAPFADLEADHEPLAGRPTLAGVLDALLKHPGRLICEVEGARVLAVRERLLVLTLLFMAGYGIVMGMFAGGHQLWFVPLKVAGGTLFASLICLPSLYIFGCLSGGTLSLRQSAALTSMATGLMSVLLVGFAPVAWVFTQSTGTPAFMGFLHLLFWGTSLLFGLRLLRRAAEFMNGRALPVLRLWGLVFVFVCLQVSTALRPLVDEYRGFKLEGKQFFLKHWSNCVR